MTPISPIVLAEKAAWQAYVDYIAPRSHNGDVVYTGDDESRRLFTVWRTLRNERDGISNPRHKAIATQA